MNQRGVSNKSWLATLLLWYFLGFLGFHRFYTGSIFIGLCQLFTLCGFGIWWVIDFILLITGSYRDGEGRALALSPVMVARQMEAQGFRPADAAADLASQRARIDTLDRRLARIEESLTGLARDTESLSEDFRFLQRVLDGAETASASRRL